MSAKNTPGPWAWEEGQGEIKREWNGRAWAVATVSECRLGWHEDRLCEAREAGANARLIAAAPELLEALQRCVNEFRFTDCIERREAISLADTAIAKATGAQE